MNKDQASDQIKDKGKIQNISPFTGKKILLATNSENLKDFIASGFIHPREGFQKYYQDMSHFSPGHLPLFMDTILPSSLPECQEESHIDGAVLSLGLPWKIAMGMISCYRNEKNKLISGIPDKNSQVKIIYYKGVIPVSAIITIFFKSMDVKKRFLDYPYSNFNPNLFSIKISSTHFKGQQDSPGDIFNEKNSTVELPAVQEPFPDYTAYLQAQARGGLVTILKHALPPLAESKNLVNHVIEPSPLDNPVLELLPRQLKHLNTWIWGRLKIIEDVDSILLYHVLDLLASYDPLKGLTSSIFLKNLQDLLAKNEPPRINPSINYKNLKQRFRERFDEIQKAVDQHIEPLSFFKDETLKSNVMRALLLFLIKQKRMVGFYKEKELIREWSISAEDLLFANIFHAVWQGWQLMDDKLRPKDKKETLAISDFMVDWFNKTHGNIPGDFFDSFFKNQTIKVSGTCMLWEKKILKKTPWKINQPLGKFAIDLAKQRNWNAVKSEILIPGENLSKISYEKNGDATITIMGNLSLKESLDRDQFFKELDLIEFTDDERVQFEKLYNK